jgi:hypothetical protein
MGLFLFLSTCVFAQLKIDQPIMHNMVLQRGKPLILSGKALPSNTVKIHIGENKTYTAVSDLNGFWKIEIPSHVASVKPFSLDVQKPIRSNLKICFGEMYGFVRVNRIWSLL